MTPVPEDRAEVLRMWHSFRQATTTEAELTDAFAFGDSPAMADKLADLVLRGPKRATAALLLEYVRDSEPVPRPGEHSVVLDGRGRPVCVVRTTDVQIKPLRSVDAAFVWDEGEGDRSLIWWRRAHREYFSRRCEAFGVRFSEDLPVVFERFEVVWPSPEGEGR